MPPVPRGVVKVQSVCMEQIGAAWVCMVVARSAAANRGTCTAVRLQMQSAPATGKQGLAHRTQDVCAGVSASFYLWQQQEQQREQGILTAEVTVCACECRRDQHAWMAWLLWRHSCGNSHSG